MSVHDSEIAIIQNLKDAGCDSCLIQNFLQCMDQGDIGEQLYLLANHRRLLLNALHEDQKQIDCLDYLVYQIEKQKKSVERRT